MSSTSHNTEWWQNESFWRDIGPFLFNEQVMACANSELEDILDLVELPNGARILDVGCGVGRLLIPLVNQGFDVVGYDLCSEYRRHARQRGLGLGLDLDIRAGSVPELGLPPDDRFDLVLDVFAAIGYSADPVGDIMAVKAMIEALKPGGTLVVRTRNPTATHGTVKHVAAAGRCLEQRRFDRETQVMMTRWSITSRGKSRVYTSYVRIYSRDDLADLLAFCGLTQIDSYDESKLERVTVVGVKTDD